MRASLVVLMLGTALARAGEESPSAFRFANDPTVKCSVDVKEVRRGVGGLDDPRDKIPSIRKPETAKAKDATWVLDSDRVLGVVVGDEARAYPLRILEVHELVNDTLGGVPIAPNY